MYNNIATCFEPCPSTSDYKAEFLLPGVVANHSVFPRIFAVCKVTEGVPPAAHSCSVARWHSLNQLFGKIAKLFPLKMHASLPVRTYSRIA